MQSIETYAKEVKYHRIYLAECQHDIALMEGRCEKNNIKVKDLVSEDTYLCRINFNDLNQLKAELEKNEKVLRAMQERYLRAAADKEDNIQSVLVNDDGFVTISYYQVVDYDGERENELWESDKMDLWQAMNAVEKGMFRHGRLTMYRQTRTIQTNATL